RREPPMGILTLHSRLIRAPASMPIDRMHGKLSIRSFDRTNWSTELPMSQAASVPGKGTCLEEDSGARAALLAATEACLRESGYSGLSTRKVAENAGMPLSQIHYHFGSKEGLVLALLEDRNRRLLQR